MKSIAIAIVLTVLCACNDAAPPRVNLAVAAVQFLDPELKCTPYYTGEGSAVLHSATCRLADKTVAYCRLTVEGKSLECGPLLPSSPPAKKTAEAQTPPMSPTPMATGSSGP